MNYQIQEGFLDLPEGYEDETVNIFKYPDLQASLVVTRTVLKDANTLESYYVQQIGQLKQNVQNFLVEDKQAVAIEHSQPIIAYETRCQFEQQGHKIHQALLMVQINQKLIVLTYSQGRPLSPEDSQRWQAIKDGFKLN